MQEHVFGVCFPYCPSKTTINMHYFIYFSPARKVPQAWSLLEAITVLILRHFFSPAELHIHSTTESTLLQLTFFPECRLWVFIHVSACASGLLLLIISLHSTVWGHHSLFFGSIDGHLGCFQFGAIMNKAAISFLTQGFLWANVFLYFV